MSFRVLIVCVGNVCRSPLAERLLAARLGPTSEFQVTSAGTHARHGLAMDKLAADQLVLSGGDPDGFKSRPWHAVPPGPDLVLTATREVRTEVLEESPSLLRRCFTLLEFAELVRDKTAQGPAELVAQAAAARPNLRMEALDIPDPMGQAVEAHAIAASLIDGATRAVAQALLATPAHPKFGARVRP